MKIAFVSGSRAEFGLSIPLIKKLHEDPFFDLKLIVTGSHLSHEFGYTIKEIEFPIAERIECLLSSDTAVGISKAVGLAVIGFAETYERIKPDLVFCTGDRFEMLASAIAAHIANIPIAHYSGGEVTEGVYDDAFRHSITKMSQLHFVSTDVYRKRVIQLGERPESVFDVGALEIEGLKKRNGIPNRDKKGYILCIYPETLDLRVDYIYERLIQTIKELELEAQFLIVNSNPDVGAMVLKSVNDKFDSFTRMPREHFLQALINADAIIGNSSAGITDAPALGVPSINIGSRQKGRLKASSVIDCEPTKEGIRAAFDKLYSKEFQESLNDIKNSYRGGDVSGRIVKILKERVAKINLKKGFYDLENC